MKTGIIVLGKNSANEREREAVEKCCRYLADHEHRNVRSAFHLGEPRSDKVLKKMFLEEGIDTFCILPMAIAEGNLTIWDMPKRLGLPDNSGSWTMIGNHDVAIRFSTAMGFSGYMANAMLARLGCPPPGTGAVVLAHGSRLSLSQKTAERYAAYLEDNGWKTACAFTETGSATVTDAVDVLSSAGCKRIVVIPLFIGTDGKSYLRTVKELNDSGIEYTVTEPVSEYPEFLEVLESKVPDDW